MSRDPRPVLLDADAVVRIATKYLTHMSDCCLHKDARWVVPAVSHGTICGRFLVGLVVLTLFRAGASFADDQTSLAGASKLEPNDLRQSAAFSRSFFAAPDSFRAPGVPEIKPPQDKDFRPRGQSIFGPDPHLNTANDELMHDTTVWQRLNEFRNRDRIRVLTLWESGASSVSLQTGKRGDPSLQWTSRLMNHGGATHGLLDRLFPVSGFGGGSGTSHPLHPVIAQPTGKAATALGGMRLGPPP